MLSKVKRVLYCSEEEEGEDVESRKLAKWCLNKVWLCVVPLLAGRQLFVVFFGYMFVKGIGHIAYVITFASYEDFSH